MSTGIVQASEVCDTLIKHYESLHDGNLSKIGLQPKLCPAGVWTVGWGHALFYKGEPVRNYSMIAKYFPEYENLTPEQADEIFVLDRAKEEEKVNKNIRLGLKQHEFDALVSYFFNIGISNTMCELVNEGSDGGVITKWFTEHYTTANGRFLQGLLNRRRTEAHLFTTGELIFY